MMLSCLNRFVVRMFRSRRDSLTLAVKFMSPLAVSQRTIDVWVGLGESWNVALSVPVQDDESLSLQVLCASRLALLT